MSNQAYQGHTVLSLLSIRRPAGNVAQRIYFKAGDVVGTSAHAIPLNREVSFVMVPDPRGRDDVAANVQLLPSTFQADQLAPKPGS